MGLESWTDAMAPDHYNVQSSNLLISVLGSNSVLVNPPRNLIRKWRRDSNIDQPKSSGGK